MIGRRFRGDRIRGSARAARVMMIALAALFVAVLVLSFPEFSRQTREQGLVIAVLLLAMVVRSIYFGVYVGPDGVRVVSWFRNYDFAVAEIEEVLDLPYDDYWTLGASPAWLQRRLRNVGIRTMATRRVRTLPVTIGSARALALIVTGLAAQTGRPCRRIELDTDPM